MIRRYLAVVNSSASGRSRHLPRRFFQCFPAVASSGVTGGICFLIALTVALSRRERGKTGLQTVSGLSREERE